jgi:uncharacterized membrane protein
MGPIQILFLGFEDFQMTGGIATELQKLSTEGIIRIIDARFLLKDDDEEVVTIRVSDLDASERAELRAAAGALMGLGAGAVLGGEEGAAAGAYLGADAALQVGEIGFSAEDIEAIGDEMEVGDALLLLVIENVWATGLRDALRQAGVVFARQDYLTPESLIALGALLGMETELEDDM